MTNTPSQLANWLGRSRTQHDSLLLRPARFMQATLGRQPSLVVGDALPPLWHWLYFLEAYPAAELGRDGHPQRGGFLPPVALPQRMWAGGRFEFHAELVLGEAVRRVSTITDIRAKTGRSGDLCFVTVQHEIFQGDTLALTEQHDIVYRQAGGAAAVPPVAPLQPTWSEQFTPSPLLLFRYSALTFNGHRIHYDVDYARAVEGYSGLVVHGPLTATLLVDLAVRQFGTCPRQFTFRALAPLAGRDAFWVEGRRAANTAELWARRSDGAMALRAEAVFAA